MPPPGVPGLACDEDREMAEAERTTPAQLETKKWLKVVEKEVASLKLETKTKVADDIKRVWANNRQKIKMSKEDQVECQGSSVVFQGPQRAIPRMSLSLATSSNSSSGEDGEKKQKKKRQYAKVVSEKTK